MQTVAEPASYHLSSGKLIDDDDLVVDDDIIAFAVHHHMRFERIVDVVFDLLIFVVGQVVYAVEPLRLVGAVLVEIDRLFLFADLVVARVVADRAAFGTLDLLGTLGDPAVVKLVFALGADIMRRRERSHKAIRLFVRLGVALAHPRDDERRARLVDQDAVHLVDDRKRELALHSVGGNDRHIVAQIVEPKLIVGRIEDVARIRSLLLRGLHAVQVDPDRQTEEAEHLAHPIAMVLREILVDGDDLHPLARQGVEICGERRDQRLAFARSHLGDAPFVEHDAAHDLHIEMPESEHARARLAHGGERLGQQLVEGLALGVSLLVFFGACGEFLVRHRLELVLERNDFVCDLAHFAQLSLVAIGEYAYPFLPRRANGRAHYFILCFSILAQRAAIVKPNANTEIRSV